MNKNNIIIGSISFLLGMCVHHAIVHIDYDKKIKKLRERRKRNALKSAINSIYGITNAKFSNNLKDPRNKESDKYTRYKHKYTGYNLYNDPFGNGEREGF